MKVLFAVSNEGISEAIVKKYQKEYKEIITYKNVYYFNAILKELQRDKSYDRIVISEDLEPFTNKNYDAIDKFIFERLDSISDEATNAGSDIPIILIGTDRRVKSEPMLVKLFGIGIYNTLIGQDRSIDKVCQLIYMPRTKKEAKIYYKIESEEVNYQAESEDTVSENEIQNILAHYKKIARNPERFVDSFNNIAAQYNDAQLRIIAKFLPLNVKTVLEENSEKYQSIMTFGGTRIKKEAPKKDNGLKMNFIGSKLGRKKLSKPVVVPGVKNDDKKTEIKQVKSSKKEEVNEFADILKQVEENEKEENKVVEPVKRGRGRPKKIQPVEPEVNMEKQKQELVEENEEEIKPVKRGRGRPKKVVEEPKDEMFENTVLPGFDDYEEEQEEAILPGMDEEDTEETVLPGFDDYDEEENEYEEEKIQTVEPPRRTVLNQKNSIESDYILPGMQTRQIDTTITDMNNNQNDYKPQISNLLSDYKKIISFVGTSKNGTSFIVNNLAAMFAEKGISTAILDMTKNRNAYYIYTKNDETLRNVAFNCMQNLEEGRNEGIEVNKFLTVYTSLPDENNGQVNHGKVIETLVRNYQIVLIDCDFDTPSIYFEVSQEYYLVQSMDILTIQPLTLFLRDLKSKNILDPNKIRIIINKETKVRGLNSKVLIGGMAYYNDPSMSFMTELFNKDKAIAVDIPLEVQTYCKYLEGLVNCEISLKGYSKIFLDALKKLGNIVYPAMDNKYLKKSDYSKNNKFSSDMNNTLNKMKNKY